MPHVHQCSMSTTTIFLTELERHCCNICELERDNYADHIEACHPGLNAESFQAQVDRNNEPVRPRYGKEMHPSSRPFSKHNLNVMTPFGFDEQVPLNRAGSEQ